MDCNREYLERVIVVDSVMGSGKTSFAIVYMNEHPEKKFIYISPLLDEADRIIEKCPELNIKKPSRDSHATKALHFHSLIEDGENIASTHSLFESIGNRTIDLLRLRGYNLILDESISVLNSFRDKDDSGYKTGKKGKRWWSAEHSRQMLQNDVETLLESNFLSVNELNQVEWIGKRLSKYDKIKSVADRNILYYINNKALMWSFPDDVFNIDVFDTITVFTYQFDYQLMSKYFEFFEIEYGKYYVQAHPVTDDYELFPYEPNAAHEMEFRKFLKSKIEIIEDYKLNKIGSPNGRRVNALSSSWWDRNRDEAIAQMDSNLDSFFRTKAKSYAAERAWTAFKKVSEEIGKNSRYVNTDYWVASTSRGTNEYRNRTAVAYCVNFYSSPDETSFFRRKELEIDNDKIATSTMLQFIFRFAIRDGKKIMVYIPSWRMRTLLRLYLDGRDPSDIRDVIAKLPKGAYIADSE